MAPVNLRPHAPALPTEARALNRSVILQQLFSGGPISRADLARVTGLTRVTVSAVVEQLLNDGLVEELGTIVTPRKAGKPATLVGLSDGNWQIAAVELSDDSALHGAILSLSGKLLERISEPWQHSRGETARAELTEFCRRLIARADKKILGLGISSPGIITPEGVIEQAPNRGWYNLPLAAQLTEELDVPVLVANDANTLALAEYTFGEVSDDGVFCLVISAGVGAGIVVSGSLLHGAYNAAGEIGHVTAVDDRDATTALGAPLPCACGRSGCLETVLSEPGLRSAVVGLNTTERAEKLAARGTRLGTILAPIIASLNTGDIVISGPADLLDGPLLEATEDTIRERTLPRTHANLRVRLSTIDADAPLMGAAVLVLSGQLGIA